MSDFLFNVGEVLSVLWDDKVVTLMVIGKRVHDEDKNGHDYAGVPYPNGMVGTQIYYFEHREVIEVEKI